MIKSLEATILGGTLVDGCLGVSAKMGARVWWKSLAMAASPNWTEGMLLHWTGLSVFVAQFRRPLFCILQEVFHQGLTLAETPGPAWRESVDEILVFAALLPLAFTNLKAECRRYVSCSDASENGGAAAEAKHFVNALEQPAAAVVDDTLALMLEEGSFSSATQWKEEYVCGYCGSMPKMKSFLCPRRCGALCCNLDCLYKHSEVICYLRAWPIPRFLEVCPNTEACFTEALAQVLVAVAPPLDDAEGKPDLLSPEGLAYVSWWGDDASTGAEHYRPPALWLCTGHAEAMNSRTATHPLGTPGWKDGNDFKNLRDANEMFLFAIGRLNWRLRNYGFCCIENPSQSWGWSFGQTVTVLKLKGVFWNEVSVELLDVKSAKVTVFVHNCAPLHAALNNLMIAQVTCTVKQLTQVYAHALSFALKEMNTRVLPAAPSLRPAWVRSELAKSTKRLAAAHTAARVTECLVKLLGTMEPGREVEHVEELLRCSNYKGAEIRVSLLMGEDGNLCFPYPAFAWRWRSVQSYKWDHIQHINVLEFLAMLNYLRSMSNKVHLQHKRFFHILDSQVVCSILAKGRSSSRRLNRCCRRMLPLLLGMDMYLYSLWTVSDWQYSDAGSRLYPQQP